MDDLDLKWHKGDKIQSSQDRWYTWGCQQNTQLLGPSAWAIVSFQYQNKQAVVKDNNVLPSALIQNNELNGLIYETCWQNDVRAEAGLVTLWKSKNRNKK